MKKLRLFILLLIFGLPASLFGQTNRFEVGIEAGPSRTFLKGNDVVTSHLRPRIGYSGGLSFAWNISKIWSIRAKLAYERKGGTGETAVVDTIGNPAVRSFDYLFDYLVLPVQARMTFGQKTKIFINAGPYFGYLLRETLIIGAVTGIPESKVNETGNFNRLDLGLSAGLGVGHNFSDRYFLSLEVRNNLGLYKISKLPIASGQSLNTNSTLLLFGFAFLL